jgi:hypothetical protein
MIPLNRIWTASDPISGVYIRQEAHFQKGCDHAISNERCTYLLFVQRYV